MTTPVPSLKKGGEVGRWFAGDLELCVIENDEKLFIEDLPVAARKAILDIFIAAQLIRNRVRDRLESRRVKALPQFIKLALQVVNLLFERLLSLFETVDLVLILGRGGMRVQGSQEDDDQRNPYASFDVIQRYILPFSQPRNWLPYS